MRMTHIPRVASTVAPPSRSAGRPGARLLGWLLLCAIHLVMAVCLVRCVRAADGDPAVRAVVLHGAVWVLALDILVGWLALGVVAGATLWVWAVATVLWALLATQNLALLGAEAVLVVAAGPLVHLAAQRHQRAWLVIQETMEQAQEEITARRAALAQAQQASAGLRKRLDRYHALQSVAERLNTFVGVEPMVQWIVEQAFALIGKSDVCLLFLVDADSQALSLAASQKGPQPVSVRAKRGDVIDQWVLR